MTKRKSRIGLSRKLIFEISRQKNEPDWLLAKRLRAYELFIDAEMPKFGPDLSGLDLDKIVYFARPDATETASWNEVPNDIRRTFDKLGILKAEKKALAGVGAQYDSEVVYHNIQKNLKKQGVIFESMETAARKHEKLLKKYFMTSCVPINDHKFIMLHAAVFSGGTFIYVPPKVTVELPLQAYFRMNARQGGQFEHTLIIADKGAHVSYIEGCSAPRYNASSLHAGCVEIFVGAEARVRYYSIENWSKNTYNLNTKRALVDKNGIIEWINGNMGAGTTMLYPCSVLRGSGASSDSLGMTFAGHGQVQDTGSKTIHAAPETKSTVRAKSICVDGGVSTYRGVVKVLPKAVNSRVSTTCDALLLDKHSSTNTFPIMKIETNEVDIVHEARVGKIGDEELFYLRSRGLSQEQALSLVVSGFVEPIIKALPLEYAVELNRLIELEIGDSR